MWMLLKASVQHLYPPSIRQGQRNRAGQKGEKTAMAIDMVSAALAWSQSLTSSQTVGQAFDAQRFSLSLPVWHVDRMSEKQITACQPRPAVINGRLGWGEVMVAGHVSRIFSYCCSGWLLKANEDGDKWKLTGAVSIYTTLNDSLNAAKNKKILRTK